MPRCSRALAGLLTAGALSVPVLTAAVAAPKKPAKPAAKKGGDAKAGKNTFKTEGCTGCHKTKDHPTAGELGPDLSAIGKEHDAKFIAGYIKKPKAGSIMPAFKGKPKDLDDMTAYLMTQK